MPGPQGSTIVKDEEGSVYWPLFGLNNIGNLTNGKGYQIKVNESLMFNYLPNDQYCILSPGCIDEIAYNYNTNTRMSIILEVLDYKYR